MSRWAQGMLAIAVCVSAVSAAAAAMAEPAPTVLTVREAAETTIAPDLLVVTLRGEADGADAATAQRRLNETVARALARVRGSEGIAIATGPYHTGRIEGTAATPTGWRAAQTIVLTARRFEALLTLAGALQDDGLAMVGMDYQASPEARATVHDRLVGEAFAALRREAAVAAQAMDMKVVGYKSLSLDQSARPMMVRAMRAGAMDAAVAPQGEGAGQSVRVDVGAEVLLAPRQGR